MESLFHEGSGSFKNFMENLKICSMKVVEVFMENLFHAVCSVFFMETSVEASMEASTTSQKRWKLRRKLLNNIR